MHDWPGTSESNGDPWPVRTNQESAVGVGWRTVLRMVKTTRMARKERVSGGRLILAMLVVFVVGGERSSTYGGVLDARCRRFNLPSTGTPEALHVA
jgi:hypothetical protein